MNGIIFGIGLAIFITYMYFLVKMINTQHKIQEKEHGKRESAVVSRYYIAKGTGKIKKKKSTKV
jgi:MFS superfamily sulfate permease-like transporter